MKMPELFHSMEELGTHGHKGQQLGDSRERVFRKAGRHRKQEYENLQRQVMMKMEGFFAERRESQTEGSKGTGCNEG